MSCLLFCMCIYIHRVITDIVCELCYACKIMALFSSIFCFCHAMHFCKIFIIVIDAKFLTLASFYTLACSYFYWKCLKMACSEIIFRQHAFCMGLLPAFLHIFPVFFFARNLCERDFRLELHFRAFDKRLFYWGVLCAGTLDPGDTVTKSTDQLGPNFSRQA